MLDVVFYEVFQEEEDILRKYLPKDLRAAFTWKTIQESEDSTPPAALISIRTQSRIPKAWAKTLEGILTRAQGYDHLVDYCRETGFDKPCGYIGNYCARAVAEHAVMGMMVLLRKLKKQIHQFDRFHREDLTGQECCGRRVLVVGVGNIGSEMVDIAKGLRMPVKGVDLVKRLKDIQYVSLKEGVAWADIIFCALPLTEKTKNMLNYEAFKKCRPGAIFVNISRGEISPLADLKRLLSENIFGGLALDIYPNEKLLAEYLRAGKQTNEEEVKIVLELKDQDNVLFTPHNAFNTVEAVEQKAKRSADAVISFLKKKTFPHPVPSVK